MGDERTNEVFIEDVFVPDEYVVGEVGKGFQYISQALDLERFTMFTFSPIKQRLDLLMRLRAHRRRATASRCATTRSSGSGSPASPPTPRSPACLGLRVVAASVKAEKVAGRAAADRRVVAVQAVRDRVLAPARRRVDGPRRARAASCGCGPRTAPMAGRAESTYRYTVIDTIGGGVVGDPEERHRPPRARPPEELLT